MTHFIEGLDWQQTMLLPEHLDDYVNENSPVPAIDAFLDLLDLSVLGFNTQAAVTGRPGYHPGLMLRINLYGYPIQTTLLVRAGRTIWLHTKRALLFCSFATQAMAHVRVTF